jgi:ADP-heptose:LPS heptosyltransferase
MDRVGDGLIKLPFLRALRRALPDGEILWCAGKGESAYARALAPLVDGLVDDVVETAGIGESWSELIGPAPFGGRGFDLVIDTQRRVKTTLILKRLRAGRFVSGAADWLLSDVRPPRGHVTPVRLVEQLLDLVALGTGRPATDDVPLILDPALEEAAAWLLPTGATYVGLVPGAGGRQKCWPLDRFVQVANAQARQGRHPVFMLGPEEAEWLDDLAAAVPDALFPLQQREATSLDAGPALTIALAARLAAAVANDSGGGHMMAAARVPMVALFGPSDPAKFAPWTKPLEIVRAQAHGTDDMAAIPVTTVLQALERLLTGDARASIGA